MPNMKSNRTRLFWSIGVAWVVAIISIFALLAAARPDPVVIVHWTNGHLLRDGSGQRLLRQMARDFNDAKNRTASGRPIVIEIYYYGSNEQAADLQSRVQRGVAMDKKRPDPVLVTPSAAHWLLGVYHPDGRPVIDLSTVQDQSIARAYIGIVTYLDMAECLGWPEKEIGYADIMELSADPKGWASYPCAKAEWGQKPLVAFTDPTTSSTGRSVLMSLYAVAAGKTPGELTVEDISNPSVVDYVKAFQGLIDHYMISSVVLNTKIYQGTRFGHFFLMPEDNLIHLIDGTEEAYDNQGNKIKAPPIEEPMVMIYPKEGTMVRNNCACLVDASWVNVEQTEGARVWVEYLREDQQQEDFMAAGFRSGTGMPLPEQMRTRYGLSANDPDVWFEPTSVDPAVATSIDEAWEEVKKPGIVAIVVDESSSMGGEKIDQAKEGTVLALDAMARNNLVGLITFGTRINSRIPIRPLQQNRFPIAEEVDRVRTGGSTALFDAILAAVRMVDSAEGDPDAIRGVVVLTDGQANKGSTGLDDLVEMMSTDEVPIRRLRALGADRQGTDMNGKGNISIRDVNGMTLAIKTRHQIQIFFIGIGNDADMDVGRILAEASGAEFQGVAEDDLAEVLARFSRYF